MALVFISYSRNDRDTYLERFFEDLRLAIQRRTALPGDQVCYWDREAADIGDEWPEPTSKALRTSGVLVPICSPAYFNSSRRGQELEAFLQRIRAAERQSGGQYRSIVPVFWHPPRGGMPGVLAAFRDDSGLPDVYAREGLRYLTRLNKFKADYSEFVDRLAAKLVAACRDQVLPELPGRFSVAAIPNAFQPATLGPSAPAPDGVTGPNIANFIYVAAPRPALAQTRKSLNFYAETGGPSWRPFNEPAGVLGQLAASRLNLHYRELPFDDAFKSHLESAAARREIVLIVVDIWTLLLDTYADRMRHYDALALPNCGMVVPWNDDDAETLERREFLTEALRRVLPQKTFLTHPAHDLASATSPSGLSAALERTLMALRMRIIEEAVGARRIEDPSLFLKAQELGLSIDRVPSLRTPSGGTRE